MGPWPTLTHSDGNFRLNYQWGGTQRNTLVQDDTRPLTTHMGVYLGGGVLLPGEQNLTQLYGWRPVACQKGYGDRSLAGCLSVLYSLRGHTVDCIKIGTHIRDAGGRVRSAGLRALQWLARCGHVTPGSGEVVGLRKRSLKYIKYGKTCGRIIHTR